MVAQKRVAIYARVSTVDKGQDPETQLLGLREYAARRAFVVVGEYVDYASGTREDRPQYQALLSAARRRQLDVVLVWRYDRFARSTPALVNALKEFHSLGVDFISYQEHIDTTTPQGELVFTVMTSLAQSESALMSERVKAGHGTRQGSRETDIARTDCTTDPDAYCPAVCAGDLHQPYQQTIGDLDMAPRGTMSSA